MESNKQVTAVEWFAEQLGIKSGDMLAKAKAMEREQKEDMLIDIDIDLALIEDCAKGELGNSITELRIKIAKLLTL